MFFSHIKRQVIPKFAAHRFTKSLALSQRVSRFLDERIQRKPLVSNSLNLFSLPKRYPPGVHEPASISKLKDSLTDSFKINTALCHSRDCYGRHAKSSPVLLKDFKTRHSIEWTPHKYDSGRCDCKLINTINAPPFLASLRHKRNSKRCVRPTSLECELEVHIFDLNLKQDPFTVASRNIHNCTRLPADRFPGDPTHNQRTPSHNVKFKPCILKMVLPLGPSEFQFTFKILTPCPENPRLKSFLYISDSLFKVKWRISRWRTFLKETPLVYPMTNIKQSLFPLINLTILFISKGSGRKDSMYSCAIIFPANAVPCLMVVPL